MENKKPIVSIVIPTRNRQKELERLLGSVKNSAYKNYEIIVVNDSADGIFLKLFPGVRVINNGANMGLAFSRTEGANLSKGRYILFIDDDNVVDTEMIGLLVKSLENSAKLMAVGPITYYLQEPKKISFLGVNINLATSKATFFKTNSDSELLDKDLLLTGNLHNCFMIKRDLGKEFGWFDKNLFMSGTEFDMFMRIKQQHPNLALATNLKAKCYHNTLELSYKKAKNFSANYASRERRLYYTQRNRGVLTGRYGSLVDKLLLGIIFYPLFTLFYLCIFILGRNLRFVPSHLKGVVDGYFCLINSGKF
jgi:GT2 family glycosyltransferase